MRRTIFLILVIATIACSNSKQEIKVYPENLKDIFQEQIPTEIKFNGAFLSAKTWTDKNGENIIILSKNGPLEEKEFEYPDGERYCELFAVQYIKSKDKYKKLWDIYDFERHCPFDITVDFLPHTTFVTDLDSNGISETTIIYRLACRSDYVPARLKLIMHQSDFKMALRGYMTNRVSKLTEKDEFELDLSKIEKVVDDYGFSLDIFGRYENENDFKNMNPEFLKYAKEKWLEFSDESKINK